jgi:LPS sulfotransferase NodH
LRHPAEGAPHKSGLLKVMTDSRTTGFSGVVGGARGYMRHLISDMGWLNRRSDYVRFIILGRSRTGSNLLRSLLNAHSGVEAYGEIFRHRDAMDWDHIGYLRSPRMHRMLLKDPTGFVERRVFRRYPEGIGAVGFKIFYYHAGEGSWATIWPYLGARLDIRVIHMTRRNILETHLSRKRAEITDSWVNTSGRLEETPAIVLEYEECLAEFERTRALEQKYDGLFSDHPKLLLTYEDLARDYASEIRRVFGFLDLPEEAVRPGIFKQNHRPLREAISNYSELKRKFSGSPWESFFVD